MFHAVPWWRCRTEEEELGEEEKAEEMLMWSRSERNVDRRGSDPRAHGETMGKGNGHARDEGPPPGGPQKLIHSPEVLKPGGR